VDPDQLYSRCNQYLKSTFIDKTDSQEIQEVQLAKMQLACTRAREECRSNPKGNSCVQFVRKYNK